jgi:hypothetical protein
VPVREIARLIGVSGRTLYKYVERYGWKRRHICLAQEEAVRKANCGRRLTPREGFAGVRGAGGRFISFEERGRAQALSPPCGPKALDPLAAEALAPVCVEAALASDEAVAAAIARATAEENEKRRDRERDADLRTLEILNKVLARIVCMIEEAGAVEPLHEELLAAVASQFEARGRRQRGG